MKQKDIALLIVIAFVSIVLSVFASKFLFNSSKSETQTVDVVPAITSGFQQPSSQFFNSQSVDSAQSTEIGVGANSNPFTTPNQ
jgi:hypothetical protein